MTITVVDNRSMTLLLGVLGVTVSMHLMHLPLWLSALVLAIGVWRFYSTRQGGRLPPGVIRLGLTFLSITAVYLQYHTLTGRDAGVALLVIMMAMKLLELRQRRDVLVLLFLAYFVLITHFLYNQSMLMASYVIITAWALITLHIHLTRRAPDDLRRSMRLTTRMMLQALPLMAMLFLLFPRIPGPLWSMPADSYSGMTGLDDSMQPGSISHLSQSDQVVFRAAFDGDPPPPELRYWRGIVLWDTDGSRWSSAPISVSDQGLLLPVQEGEPSRYTVTLEPHNRVWLFGLDLPVGAPDIGQLDQSFQIKTTSPVRERIRYKVTSYLSYNTGALSPFERHRALALPPGHNPQTIALGQQLRQQFQRDEQIVGAMLNTFRNQPFTYTLEPPLLDRNDPTDQFLFDTRKGFCEHFSSSFTMVMRAAGIPARVVTGYQGGELNPLGDYLIVRQRDAHAWSEVWLKGKGWVRVDPTAAVAPERVEHRIELGDLRPGEPVRFTLPQSNALRNVLRSFRQGLDAINNGWNQWVLGYGPEQQAQLLRKLGFDSHNWLDIAWIALWTISILFIVAIIIIAVPKNRESDPLVRIYNGFCAKLAKTGLVRGKNEGADDFARRVIIHRPDLAKQVEQITSLYNRIRYGSNATTANVDRLKHKVKQFRP